MNSIALARAAAEKLNEAGVPASEIQPVLDVEIKRGLNSASAVFVVPIQDQAQGAVAPRVGASANKILVRIATVIVCAATNDERGSRAMADVIDKREKINAALTAWMPAGQREALQFASGTFIDLQSGKAWWQDEYTLNSWAR